MMRVIYATEQIPFDPGPSIFLAGPTPRSPNVRSWRPDALWMLDEFCFEGTVFVPESRDGVFKASYDDQVEWEERGLNVSTCIMFWVPRDLVWMPALTTNDEWGFWKDSGKVVFGAPEWAAKVNYQRYYATKYGVPQSKSLVQTTCDAIAMVNRKSKKAIIPSDPTWTWGWFWDKPWQKKALNGPR